MIPDGPTGIPDSSSAQRIPRARKLVVYRVSKETEAALRNNPVSCFDVFPTGTVDEALAEATQRRCPLLVDAGIGERGMKQIAIGRGSQTLPPVIITIGGGEDGLNFAEQIEALIHLKEPIDVSYLCGALDVIRTGFEAGRLRLALELKRTHALLDLTSNMLKAKERATLPETLKRSLPRLFEASFIMVALPASKEPVVYLHCPKPLPRAAVRALRQHLENGWEALRSDWYNDSWTWIDSIPVEDDDGAFRDMRSYSPSSFVSAPITGGGQPLGFFTLLPIEQWELNEAAIQSFFVVGDLLGVVLHNFTLVEELEQRARFDGLTGLLNRQSLMERVEEECIRSRRYNSPVGLVVMDLDHFKKVNDTYGHQAGDEVLRAMARVLRQEMRDTDVAGRAGGEEFILLLPNTNITGAQQVAERVRRAASNTAVRIAEKGQINFTVSAGVAAAAGSEVDVTELIARADEALYRAKGAGRNRVEVDDPSTGPVGTNPR